MCFVEGGLVLPVVGELQADTALNTEWGDRCTKLDL